jgi:hypothetical protein
LALYNHSHALAFEKDNFSLKEGILTAKGSRYKNYKQIWLFVSELLSFWYEMGGSHGNGSEDYCLPRVMPCI